MAIEKKIIHSAEESDLLTKIDWANRTRWTAITAYVLAPIVLIYGIKLLAQVFPRLFFIKGLPFPIPVEGKLLLYGEPFYIMAFVIAIINILYILYTRRLKKQENIELRLQIFANVQIALDIVAVALVVHFSGGVESVANLFWVFQLISASTLLPVKSSYLHAAWSVLLFFLIVNLEYYGIISHIQVFYISPQYVLYKNGDFVEVFSMVLACAIFATVMMTKLFNTMLSERLEELKAKVMELAVFYNTSKIISATFEIDKVFAELMEKIRKDLHLKKYSMMLMDQKKRLTIVESYGLIEEEKGKKLKINEGIPGKVVKTGKAELVRAPEGVKLFIIGEKGQKADYLCIPLRATDKVIGVLNCYKEEEGKFSDMEMDLLNSIANNLSLATVNTSLYKQVERLSITDGLTSLYNHRFFQEQLKKEIIRANRYNYELSLIMLDVDNFKNYNDTHGHPRGDVILKQIAEILLSSVRETDTVARYGGEEFSIILPQTGKEDALVTAERIRKSIEEFNFRDEQTQPEGKLTASLGIATYPNDAKSQQGIINSSDEALYEAKSQGRNMVGVR